MPLLEDNKCRINDRDIYFELDKFKDLCGKCNVSVSDKLLETYERHGLLCPLYRIIRPKEYLQTLFEQDHGPGRISNVIEVPDEYGNLLKFEYDELYGWHHPILSGFDKSLYEGHPLEQAYKRGEVFIQSPSQETFRSWDEYKTVLEVTVNGEPIRSTDSLARHFYSPWQIYLLEEANRRHTRKVNVLIEQKDGDTFCLSEPLQKLELSEWEDYFKSLWEYRFRKNLLFSKALEGVQGNILEGEDVKKFHSDCESLSSKICTESSYELWIKFLQALCKLFFDYREMEKYRLSECLKRDIKVVIDILMNVSKKTYRDIINDVGMYLGGREYSYVLPLERIYPEYEGYLKREARMSFEVILTEYNREMPSSFTIDNSAIDEIIDYAFTSGNETLLVSVFGVNKEYFSPSYFGDERLWSFIRSLAVATESWVKEISGKNDFRVAIVEIAKGDFDSCLLKLQESCGRTNSKIQCYSDLIQFLNALPTTRFEKCGRDLSWMKYLVKAYLIRNYAAHHTRLESELFGRTLVELYRSLLFLVFYAWKVRTP